MSAAWKTIRVFISSTFRDMHAERDHLVRVVFPELRERCAKHHLHLVDVDLRWGVTEEDAQRGKALEICLREIEDCRPYFVGMLGERYGWIPPTYDIPDEERFDRLRNVAPGHSITAMEIYQGVLNNPQMRTHAFFYFRDPAFIDSLALEKQPDFRAEDDEHAGKLQKLKGRIRASGLPVSEGYCYDDLDAFGRQVLEDLWTAIRTEHTDEALESDPLDAERAYHDFFIETRTELFVGQRHLLARLHAHASGDSPGPMVVVGLPGSGKSALLARFVNQFRRLEPETFILYHFIGASPRSTDPMQILLRLCQELARRYGFEEEIPKDYAELRVRFWQFCRRAAERERFVLVLDALNQLDESYRSHELDWLPPLVPPGLRLVLSTLEGNSLEAARQKYEKKQEMIVTSLRLVDQGFIVARQLNAARKRLSTARDWRRQWRAQHGDPWQIADPAARHETLVAERKHERSQLRFILTGVPTRHREPTPQQTIERETANPLYLKLVAEELRLFGDYDRLAKFIAQLPTDVLGTFQAVLERLESDHTRDLVEHALSLIATGRHGLLECELLELLTRPGEDRFPMALWSRLYRGLAFYFKPRASIGGGDEGLIDFFHQQLAKAVRGRYLCTEQARFARHVELSGYFRRKGDPGGDDTWKGNYPRSLSEMVHHQIGSHLWDSLEHTLTTLSFLEANVAARRTFELADMLSTSVSALPSDRPGRHVAELLEQALRRDLHFIDRHWADYPQALFQCIWNARIHDEPMVTSQPIRSSEQSDLEVPAHLQDTRNALSKVLREWALRKADVCSGLPWIRAVTLPHVSRILRGHNGAVTSVDYFDDGRYLVSGSEDGTIRIWESQSGRQHRIVYSSEHAIHCTRCSPDKQLIASAEADGTIRLWRVGSFDLFGVLTAHTGEVHSLAFSHDGRFLSSGSCDKTVRVWDTQSRSEIAALIFSAWRDGAPTVDFHPSKNQLAIAYDEHSLVWDFVTTPHLQWPPELASRKCIEPDLDDDDIVLCDEQIDSTDDVLPAELLGPDRLADQGLGEGLSRLGVVDCSNPFYEAMPPLEFTSKYDDDGFVRPVFAWRSFCFEAVSFTPDGNYLVGALRAYNTLDQETHTYLTVWDWTTGTPLYNCPDCLSNGTLTGLKRWKELDDIDKTISPPPLWFGDAMHCRLITSSRRIIQAGTPEVLHRVRELYERTEFITIDLRDVAFSGEQVAAARTDLTIWTAPLNTGNGDSRQISVSSECELRFSELADHLAIAETDARVSVWRLPTIECVAKVQTPSRSEHKKHPYLQDFDFSRDGRFVLIGTDHGVHFGSPYSDALVELYCEDYELTHDALLTRFSGDGSFAVAQCLCVDSRFREFEVLTIALPRIDEDEEPTLDELATICLGVAGEERRMGPRERHPLALEVTVAADRSFAAVAFTDASVRFFDLKTKQQLFCWELRLASVPFSKGLALSADSSRLAAVGPEGRVIIWRLSDGERLCELPSEAIGVEFEDDWRLVSCRESGFDMWDSTTGCKLDAEPIGPAVGRLYQLVKRATVCVTSAGDETQFGWARNATLSAWYPAQSQSVVCDAQCKTWAIKTTSDVHVVAVERF